MTPPGSEKQQAQDLFPIVTILATILVALCIALGVSIASRFGLLSGFDLVRGAFIALLSILTTVCFYLFVHGLELEKGLSFQSNWGGLGGGLSGWRISRPVVYLIATGVLLIMLASAVSSGTAPRNTADLGFLYLADKYMPALVAAQQKKIEQIAIFMDQSRLHVTGVAPDQNAVNAVWDQIKQISPRYGDIWVDFKLAQKPAAQSETK